MVEALSPFRPSQAGGHRIHLARRAVCPGATTCFVVIEMFSFGGAESWTACLVSLDIPYSMHFYTFVCATTDGGGGRTIDWLDNVPTSFQCNHTQQRDVHNKASNLYTIPFRQY